MKALLVNGSPHEKGCTYTALNKVAQGLARHRVSSEVIWLGKGTVSPCIVCHACSETRHCAFGDDDGVNSLIDKIHAADALVVGSPVHYAGISGKLKTVLDRAFFAGGSLFAFKPAAGIVSARRAGTTAALEQLNKYFLINQMPLAASFYWPMVHGHSPEEVLQDEEGCQVAEQLGANLGWLLSCIKAGEAADIKPDTPEKRLITNFIR